VKKGEETNQYLDVMNLYPWVCKYFKFPVGHPTIYLECAYVEAMLGKEGLVRCTVLPPRNLYHHVLSHTCDGPLIFCICRPWSESGCQKQCVKDRASERAITATLVVDEVRLAVEHGYLILEIHEF